MLSAIAQKAKQSPCLILAQTAFIAAIIIPFAVILSIFNQVGVGNDAAVTEYNTTFAALPQASVSFHIISVEGAGGPSQPSLSYTADVTIPDEWKDTSNILGSNVTYQLALGATIFTKKDILPVSGSMRMSTGLVSRYPFDTYTLDLLVALLPVDIEKNTIANVNVDILVNDQYGWTVKVKPDLPEPSAKDSEYFYKSFKVEVRRSGLFKLYPVFMMVTFWLLTLVLMYFASCVLIWETKQLETPLVGVVISGLFAIPAFRNTAPQSPPIGCLLDFAGFFWTMLTLIITAISIFIRYINLGKPNQPPPNPQPVIPLLER